MTTAIASTARGTIVKVPDITPGLLFVKGEQAPFTLEGRWRSPVAPAANMPVDVDFDHNGAIVGIAVVDREQLARERLDQLGGLAQQHGKRAAGMARKGLGALAGRMGAAPFAATIVLWTAWFLLPAVSIESFVTNESLTFWQLLARDLRDPLNLPGGHGLWAFIGLLAIAAPAAAPFAQHPHARYLNAAPLVYLLLAALKLRWDISRVFDDPEISKAFLDAISFGIGAWVLGLAALFLAAHAFRTRAKTGLAIALIVGATLGLTQQTAAAQGPWTKIKEAAEKAKKIEEELKRRQQQKPPASPPAEGTPTEKQPQAAPASAAKPTATPASAKSSAKVEEQVLLTGDSGREYFVSPRGQHVAAVVLRGSRQVVVHDGVDGPKFDEVLKGAIIFSPDGTRYAYVARTGQEYVYMVDGKERARYPIVEGHKVADFYAGDTVNCCDGTPRFTSNSRHVFWVQKEAIGNTRNVGERFVFDGKPEALGAITDSISFSDDGDRYAYLLVDPQTQTTQRSLFVDGKPAGWLGGGLQFTGDSKHLLTQIVLPNGKGTQVHLDGKLWFSAPGDVRLYPAPVTDLVVVAVRNGPHDNSQSLVVGGRKIPGAEKVVVHHVYFSADGKHWAAHVRTPANSNFMVVDGKKGPDYESVIGAGFTTDGRFVYQAGMTGRHFIIAGDQESDGYALLPVLNHLAGAGSATLRSNAVIIAGNRVGFIGKLNQGSVNASVVVDFKTTPAISAFGLIFSADASRYAYAAGHPKPFLFVDGVQQRDRVDNSSDIARGGIDPTIIFSRDGKHFAYRAALDALPGRGLALNGKVIGTESPWAANLTFTPDGKHLLWLGRLAGRQGVYVDGERVVTIDMSRNLENESSWSMGADGVLTIVAQDGGSVKRFRITPSSDRSIDTMLQSRSSSDNR